MWAAWSQSDAVAPVQKDGTAGAPIAVGRRPLRLLELDGSLWVTTIRDGGLAELDPASGTVVRTVTLGEQPEGLTSLDGHLFVVLQEGAALAEVDPADGAVVRRYDVGGEPRMVAPGDGALYVGDFAGGRVVRVQPSGRGRCSGASRSVPAYRTCSSWTGRLGRLHDRQHGRRARPADAGRHGPDRRRGRPGRAGQGSGSTLLVSLQDGPGLAVVDTASGGVTRPFAGSSGPLEDKANNDVLERDGTAFVSDYTGNRVEVVRLDGS